jgi:hypothetical protein
VVGAETKNSRTILVKTSQTPPLACELMFSLVNLVVNICKKLEEIRVYVVPTEESSTVFVGELSTFVLASELSILHRADSQLLRTRNLDFKYFKTILEHTVANVKCFKSDSLCCQLCTADWVQNFNTVC